MKNWKLFKFCKDETLRLLLIAGVGSAFNLIWFLVLEWVISQQPKLWGLYATILWGLVFITLWVMLSKVRTLYRLWKQEQAYLKARETIHTLNRANNVIYNRIRRKANSDTSQTFIVIQQRREAEGKAFFEKYGGTRKMIKYRAKCNAIHREFGDMENSIMKRGDVVMAKKKFDWRDLLERIIAVGCLIISMILMICLCVFVLQGSV